jgi:hypothetical protein
MPPADRGYRGVVELIARSHETSASKAKLRREAARLFRSLRRAQIVEIARDARGRLEARVAENLQLDFSLHHTLSLFLVDAVAVLDRDSPSYALELLTLVEAILEDPRVILYAQVRKHKAELMAALKAQRVPFEERIAKLERVSHPKPDAEFVYAAFRLFVETHPWFGEQNIRLKSIAREMFEHLFDFAEYTREYAIARSEGLLLRYLNQVLGALAKTIPDAAKTDAVYDAIAFFRTLIKRVDSSLIDAWETLADPEAALATAAPALRAFDLANDPALLAARARAELHALVRALSKRDFEAAAACVAQHTDDPWDARRFERALAPYFEEYDEILFTPDARNSRRTQLRQSGPRSWDVTQVLVDPQGDDIWAIDAAIDLRQQRDPEEPIVRIRRIGS